MLYETRGHEKSIEFYDKALEQQANHPGFILNIAISQFMLGNKGLAKQKYDEAVALAPSFSGKLEDILGAAKAMPVHGDEFKCNQFVCRS